MSDARVDSSREQSGEAKSLLSHVSLEACAAVTKAAPAKTHTAQPRLRTQSQRAILQQHRSLCVFVCVMES